jgi:hypothetical protein
MLAVKTRASFLLERLDLKVSHSGRGKNSAGVNHKVFFILKRNQI